MNVAAPRSRLDAVPTSGRIRRADTTGCARAIAGLQLARALL